MGLITINLGQLTRMEGALSAAAAKGRDLTPLMDRIGMAMETTTQERFESESDAKGRRWKPSIRARQTGGKTLTDKGHLANSITHRAGPSQVEIGSNLIYAAPNFFGATITAKSGHLKFSIPGLGFRSVKSVTLPARNPLGIGGDDAATIGELVGDFFLEGMAA